MGQVAALDQRSTRAVGRPPYGIEVVLVVTFGEYVEDGDNLLRYLGLAQGVDGPFAVCVCWPTSSELRTVIDYGCSFGMGNL